MRVLASILVIFVPGSVLAQPADPVETPAAASSPAPTPGQTLVEPERPAFDIDAAIARGVAKKADELLLTDNSFGKLLMAGSEFGTEGFSIRIYSPETWIAMRAEEATRKYMRFTRENITPEDLAPLLRVTVYPDMPKNMKARGLADSVKHAVVRDAGKTEAVQPINIEQFDESRSNLFGAEVKRAGAHVTFDLEEVMRLSAKDPKGEFLITIVGESESEKTFRIKERHLAKLRLH